MMSWFIFGIIIGLSIRCLCRPYKNEEEKYKDPWNWTSFGGGG